VKRRPWPIVFLAALQLLCPVASILVSALVWHATPAQVLATVARELTVFQQIDLFGLPLLAAASLFCFRPWSYPVFIAISAWTLVSNYQTWEASQGGFSAGWLGGLSLLNTLFIGYFLAPSVRQAYFNARVRWWESLPRFRMDLPGTVAIDGVEVACRLEDVSAGGALVELDPSAGVRELHNGETLHVRFGFHHQRYSPRARVVHRRLSLPGCYGVQFLKDAEAARVARLMRALKLLGFPIRQERPPWQQDLAEWARSIPRDGWRAFFPRLPGSRPAEPAAEIIPLRTERKAEPAGSAQPDPEQPGKKAA
jgi:hypothetical protein